MKLHDLTPIPWLVLLLIGSIVMCVYVAIRFIVDKHYIIDMLDVMIEYNESCIVAYYKGHMFKVIKLQKISEVEE